MARKKGNKAIKKLRKEVIPVARKFDEDMHKAVEDALGMSFDELDTTKFSVNEELGILMYDGKPIVIANEGGICVVKE